MTNDYKPQKVLGIVYSKKFLALFIVWILECNADSAAADGFGATVRRTELSRILANV